MNLDPETLAGIKSTLRLNPQGASLEDLATKLGVTPAILTGHLEFLTRIGEVRVKLPEQPHVYLLTQAILAAPMLRFSKEMAVLLDDRRRIIQMNDAFQSFSGGDSESSIGRELSGIADELTRDLPLEDYLAHPEEQTVRTFIRFVQEDGKDRFFQVRMAPWPFEDGAWGLVILIEEETARRTAELALAESQHLFREVLQNIQDVFYRSNTQGNLVLASDSLARMLGYDSVDECIGRNAAETFYMRPGDRSEMLAQLRRDGAVWDYEVLLKKKDGTPVPVSMNSHLIYSPEGTELGVEGTFRKIRGNKAP